ncbi:MULTISPECIES: molybdopterin molybdotransferase MoeA [unclassified Streptomyces]|uniref:molybdopterin molybdotransferase MoeA n=1 Tax=unclassified Streptomyces TaxID=2593676 RepID=UPI002251DA7E|nr:MULTISPECIES: molybdopterin molybdotransferase MoeA [unclassified Streptomyces]MCX4989697.1 molybdopterin molybdotransferase MoeA [Streptomyces sp. NBC_00568]MCX5005063.1 molybdopterin molybdotransferase MoeA [Streptomyces sp. NBC_00638]
MTAARSTRDSQDADDFDVEEALALVKKAGARAPGEPGRADSAVPDLQGTDRAAVPAPNAQDGGKGGHTHHRATPWPEARAVAERAARSVPRRTPVSVPLDASLGLVLAAPLTALTDLPSFDTSAMDGWAVAGPGPWEVREHGVLAGQASPERLTDGEAVRIATGARVPRDATAVLRSEHGRLDTKGRLHASDVQTPGSARSGGTRAVAHGQDIRPRGQECRSGDQLLPLGALVTPAVLGLAAAAGYDTLAVVPRPRAEVLVLGDELLTEGLPQEGLIRDALGPMLPPWLRALGVEVVAVRRLGDDAKALHKAITGSRADLIVTTGGTAAGPVDHVHPTLRRIGAELLVDGVKVRPGHPMLLARTQENQHLVGLPGNPLAAVSGLLTLAEPLLRTLAGRAAPESYTLPLKEAVQGHPYDTRLVPVSLRGDRAAPLHYNGPAMLRGIAAADALAVVPPGGARAGQELELIDLPWATAGIDACFI